MAFGRYRDRSGLTTRRRVIAYLQDERDRRQKLYPDRYSNSYYLVDSDNNYLVDESGNYFVVEGTDGQASLI